MPKIISAKAFVLYRAVNTHGVSR